jgi:hypothetical protein
MLVPVVGVITALRLAKPGSAWGRRLYAPGSRKHERAAQRYARHTRRYQRFQDSVAGAPHLVSTPAADDPPDSP